MNILEKIDLFLNEAKSPYSDKTPLEIYRDFFRKYGKSPKTIISRTKQLIKYYEEEKKVELVDKMKKVLELVHIYFNMDSWKDDEYTLKKKEQKEKMEKAQDRNLKYKKARVKF